MRISLIRPRSGNAPDPPLGLLSLTANLQPLGHVIQVMDPDPSDIYVMDRLEAFRPDLVGMSLLTTQVARGLQLQSQIKSRIPAAKTVGGGIHPTALPEWTLKKFGFDFVVVGEGERTFPDAIEALESHRCLDNVPGIAMLRDGILLRTAPRPLIEPLDALPFPDRSAVQFDRYLRPPGNIRGKLLWRGTSIIASRGCPFGCIFCSSKGIFGSIVRRRSVDHVMKEIELLIRQYKIDGIWFLDDTLLEDRDWLLDLCKGMHRTGLPWGCQAHVRRADEGLFREMRRHGCLQLEFGVESGSPRMLRRLRKGSDLDDIRRAFAICRRVGLRTLANFMIGIPDETLDDAKASLKLAREIRPDHVVVTFTTPLPGSVLFDEAQQKGWLPDDPDFSERWIIRQTEMPAVTISLDAITMQAIRREFDNAFFWRNIREYLLYPSFLFDILRDFVRRPRGYLIGIVKALRTRRLGHIAESVWEEYNRV